MAIDLAREPPFQLGPLRVEPALRAVRDPAGTQASLEPRVMQVLITLVRARGGTLSRAELREHCWEGRATSEDAVDRVIARLRRLSEEMGKGSFTIETIPKVGYRLKAACDVEELPAATGLAVPPARRWPRRLFLGGAVAAIGAVTLLSIRRGASEEDEPASAPGTLTVAVLPFRASEANPANDAIARLLSDEVRASLSRIREIRVIAETSSAAIATERGSARAIGERLGADLLVEAQLSLSAGDLRVHAALIQTSEQRQLWSESIEGRRDDLPSLRTALSGALVEQIAGLIPLARRGDEQPVRRPDPQAYSLVAEANRLLSGIRTTSMTGEQQAALAQGERAEALARQALAIDANYSGAWLVLAVIARNGWTPALAARPISTQQRVQQSIQFVRRALLADPGDPGALAQLGDYYRRYEFRWNDAENLFRRAIDLNPSLVEAHWSYAYLLGTTGRAIEGLDHAIAVFELDPGNAFRRIALPRLLYVVGQRNAAMRRYDVELAQQPNNLFLLRELYLMFLAEGNRPDLSALLGKIERQRSALALPTEVRALSDRIQAGIAALSGATAALKALVDADVAAYDSPAAIGNATPQGRARDDLPYIFSIEYAWAGETERALDMLERALAAKSLYWPATLPFGRAPYPAAVRRHPRFAALWRRDAGLRLLIARRRDALSRGQMAGFTAGGQVVLPVLSADRVARIRRLLAGA